MRGPSDSFATAPNQMAAELATGVVQKAPSSKAAGSEEAEAYSASTSRAPKERPAFAKPLRRGRERTLACQPKLKRRLVDFFNNSFRSNSPRRVVGFGTVTQPRPRRRSHLRNRSSFQTLINPAKTLYSYLPKKSAEERFMSHGTVFLLSVVYQVIATKKATEEVICPIR